MIDLRDGLFPSEALAAQYRECLRMADRGQYAEAWGRLFGILGKPLPSQTTAMVENDLAVLAYLQGDHAQAEKWLARSLLQSPSNELATRNQQIIELASRAADSAPPQASRSADTPHSPGALRVAIVSLLFNWPTTGGGNVHTVELAMALGRAGYAVHHVFVRYAPWEIGSVRGPLPHSTEVLEFSESSWSMEGLQQRIRHALARYRPDVVLLTDCWNTKPWLAEALEGYPYIVRFDALECICPLNNLRLLPTADKNVRTCPRSQLANPGECQKCVGQMNSASSFLHQLEREFAGFATGQYLDRLKNVLRSAAAVLVHNPLIEALIEPFASRTCVVPIGVDANRFQAQDRTEHDEPVRLLFAGRVLDVSKGFPVLVAAGKTLWQRRQDFRVVATGRPQADSPPFVEWAGWRPHADVPALLAQSDVLIAPATAQEPFGLSAIEAMAAGMPVIASEVGGLQFMVVDGLTGWLCPPGNVVGLARRIEQLLDDRALGLQMGRAGRSRFEREYSWPAVIEQHYRPLFADACRA